MVKDKIKMEDLQNVKEDVPRVLTASVDVDIAGTVDDNEISSCSTNSLSISTPMEKALRNPVILQHLFQLCPVWIVASCRLVCKQWYEESLMAWRTAFPVTITMENEAILVTQRDEMDPYHYRIHPQSSCTPFKEFLEFCDKPENQCSVKPYRNVDLHEWQFQLNSEEFKIFWKAIGSYLTSLSLTLCTFSSVEEFRKVIFKSCPVLQKLNIRCCTFPTTNTSGGEEHHQQQYVEPLYGEHKHLKSLDIAEMSGTKFPISWLELFSHFPLLISFQASYGYTRGEEPDLESVVDAIRIIRSHDKNKLPFKRFQFGGILNIPTLSRDPASHHKFNLMSELHLPLTDIFVKVHRELDESFFKDTLHCIAASVNSVILFAEKDVGKMVEQDAIPTWMEDFPFGNQLNNLTKLEVAGDALQNFKFLKYSPNLAILKISRMRDFFGFGRMSRTATKAISNTCKDELVHVKMLRLTKFVLDFIVSDEDVQHLFKWMPNITDLTMVLNDKQFGMVCRNWKYLRSLKVLGKELLTEEGVTEMDKGHQSKEVGFRPSIANLECVEWISIEDIKFTALAVCHLFVHLPSLLIFKHFEGSVEREDLDLSSYHRVIQVQSALYDIHGFQEEVYTLGEKAKAEIVQVQAKYNELRKPCYDKRAQLIEKIPKFWIKAFLNHPDISMLVQDEEKECLDFIKNLEVEELETGDEGVRIKFIFDENPFFDNLELVKEITGSTTESNSTSTTIKWKDSMDLSMKLRQVFVAARKRKTFFSWFKDDVNEDGDWGWANIVAAFRYDLWPNPLQYYLGLPASPEGSMDDGDEENMEEDCRIEEVKQERILDVDHDGDKENSVDEDEVGDGEEDDELISDDR